MIAEMMATPARRRNGGVGPGPGSGDVEGSLGTIAPPKKTRIENYVGVSVHKFKPSPPQKELPTFVSFLGSRVIDHFAPGDFCCI